MTGQNGENSNDPTNFEDGLLILTTGVVLRVTDVSTAALAAVRATLFAERPTAPVVYIEAIEEREANTNDPDYIAAVGEWEERLSVKQLNMAVYLGTKVDSMPEGFPRPEDREWTEDFARFGIEIPEDPADRYMAWVRYRAAPTRKDIADILLATSRRAGVTEEDAAEAAASFRDPPRR